MTETILCLKFYHILRSRVQILDCDWLNSGHYEATSSAIVCEDFSHYQDYSAHPGTYQRFEHKNNEGNRALKPDSFTIRRDEHGLKYATLTFNEETKNHKDYSEKNKERLRGFM